MADGTTLGAAVSIVLGAYSLSRAVLRHAEVMSKTQEQVGVQLAQLNGTVGEMRRELRELPGRMGAAMGNENAERNRSNANRDTGAKQQSDPSTKGTAVVKVRG